MHELENFSTIRISNLIKDVIDEATFLLHTDQIKLNHQKNKFKEHFRNHNTKNISYNIPLYKILRYTTAK